MGARAGEESLIAPHPGLTVARAIAIDYGIRGASTSLRMRRALLDVSADVRPAQEQHIVLLNRAEVEAARVRGTQT
jgi:hypothetical protein